VQPRELGAHRDSQLGIEVRERLVHEIDGRLGDRMPYRDALALPTRERVGTAVEERLELQDRRRLADLGVDALAWLSTAL
jgi:hypothetical protein